MTTRNHLNSFEKLEPETMDNISRTADELLCIEHLDFDNTRYLASALFCLGRYDESIEQFERMLSMKCDDKETIACLAINHFQKQDYRTALEYLNRGLEIDPENRRMLSYRMLSYEYLGDFKGAVRCGERILEKNPKYEPAISHLIDCHLELGNYDECLDYISQMKYEDPCRKALILYRAKRFEECIMEAGKVKTAQSYRLTGKAYHRLGNEMKAVKYLYRSYEKDENVDILFEISDIYSEIGDYQRAVHFLKEALLHDENNAETCCRIAHAYLRSSKLDDAVEYGEKTLEINKKMPKAYSILASATFQMTVQPEKSLEIIEEGLRENPESVELWCEKGSYGLSADVYGFEQAYEKAISLNPNDCETYKKYIFVLLLCGEYEAAKKQYNQMLLFNPLFEKNFEELKESMHISC